MACCRQKRNDVWRYVDNRRTSAMRPSVVSGQLQQRFHVFRFYPHTSVWLAALQNNKVRWVYCKLCAISVFIMSLFRLCLKSKCQNWRQQFIITLCLQKYTPWWLIITLANVDRFSQFFQQLILQKILYDILQRFPPHLQCVATLPCESFKSKNVTDFDSILNKLLACFSGHFEDLI